MIQTAIRTNLLFIVTVLLSTQAFAGNSLNGAGSTFVEPVFTKWFSEYQKSHSDLTVNYQGIGSGGGIRQLIAGTVDFAGSDAIMTSDELKTAGKAVIHIPMVMGAVVVSYNLKLDKPLKLSGTVMADIFSGKIKKWNDEKIMKLNAGVKLPNTDIVVATRSDGSGTTAIFSEYLEKVSPDWKGKAGKSVDWFKGSIAAKGNAGVAGLIKQAEGTIGYIELVYAVENKLPYAQVLNKKGEFVEASLKSVAASATGKALADANKNDFKVSLTNSDAKGAYPISSFTWMLVFENMPKEKGQSLVNLIKWTMDEKTQQMATQINYASLPKDLRKNILARISKIKLN